MKTRLCILAGLFAAVSAAQLTTDQRQSDLRNLADLYARRYAGIEWKKLAFNYDVLDLAPWLARTAQITNDLDFYALMVQYVSDLQDAHDEYLLPSDFEAHLGFTVDIYSGNLLIDSIDRTVLPVRKFPFQVGDQLVSVDGQAAADMVKAFSPYVTGGNPRTVSRFAAEVITDRYQEQYPYAAQIGGTAAVVILRQNGSSETYQIPWQTAGTPITTLGPSPGPTLTTVAPRRSHTAAPGTPYYQQFLQQVRQFTLPGRINVLGFDQLQPVFALPNGFVQRLGTKTYDSYYSGTYNMSDGTRVGYLRVPDFLYPSLTDLDKEIAYFQSNVDVMVVDVMRNPGGDVCSAEDVLSRLTGSTFTGSAAEFRVDWTDIMNVNAALNDVQYYGADPDTLAQLQLYQDAFSKAFMSNNGRTGTLPICASTTSRNPAAGSFTKPVLLLVDEMSASSADIFAAMAQDNHIATLFGYRTMGAGGSPEGDYAGVYTEGSTSVTRSLVVRPQPVVTPEYPTTNYIENVGVRPDTVFDYMTPDNLLNQGAPFVAAFSMAAWQLIN